MDPLTAVGLASNVVQFVSFAGDLISKGKEIARSADGALVENLEIEAVTQSLHELSKSLIIPNVGPQKRFGGTQKPTQADRNLQELSEKARDVAEELLGALRRLKMQSGTSTPWANFRQAFIAVLSADKIDQLSTRLDRFQQQINTALLVSLREHLTTKPVSENVVQGKMGKFFGKEDNNPSKHSATIWRVELIDALRESDRKQNQSTETWRSGLIDALYKNDWQDGKEQDTSMFASRLTNGAEADRDNIHMLRIYHMLRFSEIEERQEAIAKAHQKTFEWVFQGDHRPSDKERQAEQAAQWDNFIRWLHSDKHIYWITGKPGSGKSTLMKYISRNARTRQHAEIWSGSQDLVTAGFFFWNSGTTMQMSFHGLLQSLLYQAVAGRLSLISQLFPARWQNHQLFGRDLRPWSLSELNQALRILLSMESLRFLIFIDGLDEFDKDPAELVSFVTDIDSIAPNNLKLCVASRPWLVFEEKFAAFSRLRLEDLTRPDIQLHWKSLLQFHPTAAEHLMTEVVDKASGVFLWVTLVIASLLNGLRDGDTIADLTERVGRLPSGLEDLFRSILKQLEPDYLVQACEMFQLVTEAVEPLTMLDIYFAIAGFESCMNAKVKPLMFSELCFMADNARRRILSRCKGLLETHDFELRKHDASVQFLHRTVRDFFRSPEIWHYIRSQAPLVDPVNLDGRTNIQSGTGQPRPKGRVGQDYAFSAD
ncbi:hypothetical protein EJ04DRAFT_556507 [Polyplosphaeria fusca]|uniref:NACHT domain-containing protein n=1 Tax=Polyplosphaeria fusca TaxID=682080 RepID=A0A9P4QPS1_9PLEO|nr:hypothetical protein EJ04DRAFT_556507 [Polyplosphaeria fusca]